MAEVDLDVRPRVEPERGGALAPSRSQQLARRDDVAPQLLPPGDALELAQLLERVDADVRVRADAERDPALEQAADRREAVAEIRLRRRADADPRAGVGEQVELGSSACVACTIVVRGAEAARRASSSIGRSPCSARHSSISRGCSSAWT